MKSIPYKELTTAIFTVVVFLGLILNPEILILLAVSSIFSLILTGIVSTDLFHNFRNKHAREAIKRVHRIERNK